jgi:hypothetical protein
MAATLRALLLAVPVVAAVGLLRPAKETALVHEGLHPTRFWAEKARIRGTVNVALAGDSRVYRGISPAEMVAGSPSFSGRIENLGFSGACLCEPYLGYVERALVPSASGPRVIVFGVTPHSLTPHAAKDNGFVAELRRPITEVFERRYVLPALDWLEPIELSDVFRAGPPTSAPQSKYTERFLPDGWVASDLVPPKPDGALREYTSVLGSSKVDAGQVEGLVGATARWTAAKIRVVAFRPPTSAAMRRLEDELGVYDEPTFRERFVRAGGEYLTFEDASYTSYDGSHLGESSARAFSRDLAKRLFEPKAP